MVNSALNIDEKLKSHMTTNPKYGEESWEAYHNMWWILDSEKGEFVQLEFMVRSFTLIDLKIQLWFGSRINQARSTQKY